MPKGPNGEKRPTNTFRAAVKVALIATGEIEDDRNKTKHLKSGKAGGKARGSKLTAEKRRAITEKGAAVRWSNE
jgi:hypothetical protein